MSSIFTIIFQFSFKVWRNRTLLDTRLTIDILFGEREVTHYNELPDSLQHKYRLYITRRKNVQRLYKNLFEPQNDCLSPSEWEQEYEKKKDFETIAEKLNLPLTEVMEIYDSAISKMKRYCTKKGIKIEDYLD